MTSTPLQTAALIFSAILIFFLCFLIFRKLYGKKPEAENHSRLAPYFLLILVICLCTVFILK